MTERRRANVNAADWRKIVDFTKRESQTPKRPPAGRRSLWHGLPQQTFLGVLEEDLEADGTAAATVWGYYPDDEEERDAGRPCTVRGWLLPEGATWPEGSRIIIAIIGPAAYALHKRNELGDCLATIEGIPVSDVPGFVEGEINVPYLTEDGCWAFTQPNTEC